MIYIYINTKYLNVRVCLVRASSSCVSCVCGCVRFFLYESGNVLYSHPSVTHTHIIPIRKVFVYVCGIVCMLWRTAEEDTTHIAF